MSRGPLAATIGTYAGRAFGQRQARHRATQEWRGSRVRDSISGVLSRYNIYIYTHITSQMFIRNYNVYEMFNKHIPKICD